MGAVCENEKMLRKKNQRKFKYLERVCHVHGFENST